MKCVVLAFACSCLILPASAQQVIKELLPTPPNGDKLEVRLVAATIQPSAVGKWHTYPNYPIAYVAGTLTVEFRGEPKVYKAGQGLVEPINTVFRGVNKGQIAVKLVIFQLRPREVPDAVDPLSQQKREYSVSLKRGSECSETETACAGTDRGSVARCDGRDAGAVACVWRPN